MNIAFADKALEELFINCYSDNKEYKQLPKDIVKRYVKVVNFIRAARRVEDLFTINSLHYEKKSGNLNGLEAVWINDKYRLLFKSSPNGEGIIVNALLIEISKHYE